MKKKILCAFVVAAGISFQACNNAETHEQGADHPSGETQGPASGEDAREKVGEDPNDQGKEAASNEGDQAAQ